MPFQIQQIVNHQLDQVFEQAMLDFNNFFELNWITNRPNVILVPDRKTIDNLKGRKTESWLVGWANQGEIYLLAPENYQKESNHQYSDQEYFALLKHELAHCFSNLYAQSTRQPIWLLEGISIFLSGQNLLTKPPTQFTQFLNFYSNGGQGVYAEAGFAVEFLVNQYGKTKLLDLLKQSKNLTSPESLQQVFQTIYSFSLSYENFHLPTQS